jgi:hypothetical protein
VKFVDPGWVKIRIRDKHPGSETLLLVIRVIFLDPDRHQWHDDPDP